jgi:hypothetical protein
MPKKLMTINVRGKRKRWGFQFYGDPKHLSAWRADGLQIDEVVNTIPNRIADLGLVRAWCCIQDLVNFRKPWA